MEDSANLANELAETGEFLEAGDFLYSVASLIEEIDHSKSLKILELVERYWEKQISSFKIQAKLHEIAEIYIRLAELHATKFKDKKLERKNIRISINFLKQESKLLKDFNEIRKVAQNYQNIAELYLKILDYKRATKFYAFAIDLSKSLHYFDLLAYSYQQIASCFQELDDFDRSNDIILDGIEYFLVLFKDYEEKNEYLTIAQLSQVLRKLFQIIDDKKQFVNYSKKEAGAYINLAENLEKIPENFQKIARFYRGAALCYQEIDNNLIESASCFVLAGNYSEKIEDYNESAVNFFNAAVTFKEMNNLEMTYKNYIKAADNYWKNGNVNDSTESYLNAYDIAIEGDLEYNQFGLFNQIVRGLSIIAKEGLKNKKFYTAATLILESIKFYQKLDTAKDFLLKEMVRNVYKYYYKAANLKKIGKSHIVQSYVLAAISSILNGRIDKAREIISKLDSTGNTERKYIELVEKMIKWINQGKSIEFEKFSYPLQRIIENSEEIMYLLRLFKGYKI